MATLAADKLRDYVLGDFNDLPVIAADIIYEGAAVGEVAASGHMRPLEAGDAFKGFALGKCDNSAGAAAAKNVRVRTRGAVVLPVTSVAITNLGQAVYASDDATFVLTKGSNSLVGYVHRFISSGIAEVAYDTKVSDQAVVDDAFNAATYVAQ